MTEQEFQEYMYAQVVAEQIRGGEFAGKIRPKIRCASGWAASIQASNLHYSTPRLDGLEAYSAGEIGFPTSVSPELLPYAENDDDESDKANGVFPYVPVSVIVDIINNEGGIVA